MNRLSWLTAALLLSAVPVLATPITIEPDDYAAGTDLTTISISPWVTLSTTGGEAVYSSTIHSSWGHAAQGQDTGPLGEKVFSRRPDANDEWYYWHDSGSPELQGLSIAFNQAVSSVSLLFAELFEDAGCCTSDPIYVYIYGTDGALQAALSGEELGGYLGTFIDEWDGSEYEAFPWYEFTYSGSNIGRVVVGGESEPTTIDRLTFTLEHTEVPAPAAASLFALMLAVLGVKRRR